MHDFFTQMIIFILILFRLISSCHCFITYYKFNVGSLCNLWNVLFCSKLYDNSFFFISYKCHLISVTECNIASIVSCFLIYEQLIGTMDAVRSDYIRFKPQILPDAPHITITVVGLEERRQIEKVTCDLLNKRDWSV